MLKYQDHQKTILIIILDPVSHLFWYFFCPFMMLSFKFCSNLSLTVRIASRKIDDFKIIFKVFIKAELLRSLQALK